MSRAPSPSDPSTPPAARSGLRARTIRILIADDHALVREGLRLLVRSAPDILVVGEASSATAALELLPRLRPDVLVLDLDIAQDGRREWEPVRVITRAAPHVPLLILAMFGEPAGLLPLLQAGARGYLAKGAARRDLLEAIRVVAGGGKYTGPAPVSQRAATTARERFASLSDREQSILRLTAEGSSGAEIARLLGISTKTVDTYKHRIDAKLGLAHRRDYVRFAVEAGILRY